MSALLRRARLAEAAAQARREQRREQQRRRPGEQQQQRELRVEQRDQRRRGGEAQDLRERPEHHGLDQIRHHRAVLIEPVDRVADAALVVEAQREGLQALEELEAELLIDALEDPEQVVGEGAAERRQQQRERDAEQRARGRARCGGLRRRAPRRARSSPDRARAGAPRAATGARPCSTRVQCRSSSSAPAAAPITPSGRDRQGEAHQIGRAPGAASAGSAAARASTSRARKGLPARAGGAARGAACVADLRRLGHGSSRGGRSIAVRAGRPAPTGPCVRCAAGGRRESRGRRPGGAAKAALPRAPPAPRAPPPGLDSGPRLTETEGANRCWRTPCYEPAASPLPVPCSCSACSPPPGPLRRTITIRQYAGHPLRIVAYVLHPVGVLFDYLIFRPAHWIGSKEPMKTIFGHTDD